MLTLRELRAKYPAMFYRQEWFDDEPFMDVPCPEDAPDIMPSGVTSDFVSTSQPGAVTLVPAVALARLYVAHSAHPLWRQRYLWTSDHDRLGQQVYVGDNGKGLEIHRHLHLTTRWGRPVWYHH